MTNAYVVDNNLGQRLQLMEGPAAAPIVPTTCQNLSAEAKINGTAPGERYAMISNKKRD